MILQGKVLIGIHVTAAAQDIGATLVTLYEQTATPFEPLLLIDPAPGEAEGIAAGIAGFVGVPRILVGRGAPASFDILLAQGAALSLFLEAGARPGGGWLARLIAALDADPAHGIAGPSTNRSWNAQGIAPDLRSDAASIAAFARRLATERQGAWCDRAPLHDLSDACLLVRRAVVEAIGGADEAYGRAPCWELDYTARAARAGFRSVWAEDSFVYRAPLPDWRIAHEPAAFEASRRRYQDRFCGRRADAPAMPYHLRCVGEACADFASTGSIERLALPGPAPAKPSTDKPLISCCLPTKGRPSFVARSIDYFRRQDYPNRELIIIYDEPADLPVGIDGDDVRLVRSTARSIGEKREQATALARGEIIAQWDDDDWYAPTRLSRQVAPILAGIADVTGLNDLLFLATETGRAWQVTPELFATLFVENVSGGTLVFRRSVWQVAGPYPPISLREDCEFLLAAMARGARLCRLPGRDQTIYVRHGRNSWRFAAGAYLDSRGWSLAAEPAGFAADHAFYLDGRPALALPVPRSKPAAPRQPVDGETLISCIMPTFDRRRFVPSAIDQFLAQTHAAAELIIIDDGNDRIADLVPDCDRIRYLPLARRATIGAKRNIACDQARGEVIAHWDDDDWMAPGWLEAQLATLVERKAELAGLDRIRFYAPALRAAWRYTYDGDPPWVFGGTLCYTKALWQRVRFRDTSMGEDNLFVWDPAAGTPTVNARDDLYVATVHRHNSSPKITAGRRWRRIPADEVEGLIRSPAPA